MKTMSMRTNKKKLRQEVFRAGYRAGFRAGYRRARRVKARKQAISISMFFYRLYRAGKWI